MHYSRAIMDRASTGESGPLRFVAATEGPQDDNIDLRMSGAKLDRYKANPVLLYGHRHYDRADLPIGRSTNVEVEGPRLMIDVEFDQGDEFAAQVERKYRDGFMNAVSIGFDVHAWQDKGSYWLGGVAEQWELIEVSAVSVPMDAGAVVESGRARGIDLRELLAGVPPDPCVVVERDGPWRSVRVSEELLVRADPLLLAADIARQLAIGPFANKPTPSPGPVIDTDAARSLLAALTQEKE